MINGQSFTSDQLRVLKTIIDEGPVYTETFTHAGLYATLETTIAELYEADLIINVIIKNESYICATHKGFNAYSRWEQGS